VNRLQKKDGTDAMVEIRRFAAERFKVGRHVFELGTARGSADLLETLRCAGKRTTFDEGKENGRHGRGGRGAGGVENQLRV
jgi:hypothetical protein